MRIVVVGNDLTQEEAISIRQEANQAPSALKPIDLHLVCFTEERTSALTSAFFALPSTPDVLRAAAQETLNNLKQPLGVNSNHCKIETSSFKGQNPKILAKEMKAELVIDKNYQGPPSHIIIKPEELGKALQQLGQRPHTQAGVSK